MKRSVRSLVAAAVCAFCLAGCGGNDNGSSEQAGSGGMWRFTLTCSTGCTRYWIMNLSLDGTTLSGTAYREGHADDANTVAGIISGSTVRIEEYESNGAVYVYEGTVVDSTTMRGAAAYTDGSYPYTWTAVKQ